MRTASNALIAKLTEDALYREVIPASTFATACVMAAFEADLLATALFAGVAVLWFAAVGIAKSVAKHRRARIRLADMHTVYALELRLRQEERASKALITNVTTQKLAAVTR